MASTAIAPEDGTVTITLASTPNSKILAKLLGKLSYKIAVPGFLDEEAQTYFSTPITESATIAVADVNNEIVVNLSGEGDVPGLPPEWKESIPVVALNWVTNLIVKPLIGMAGLSETVTFGLTYTPPIAPIVTPSE